MTRIIVCHHTLVGNVLIQSETRIKYKTDGWVGGRGINYLILVSYHVPETLIVNNSKKDICFKFSTIHATVHPLRTIVIVTSWKINQELNGSTMKT